MMHRRRSLDWQKCIWIAVVWLLLSVHPASVFPVIAQEEPDATHTFTFAQQLEIALSIDPALAVDEAWLSLKFLRGGQWESETYLQKVREGRARYRRDLREEPLPPFTTVTYQWAYEDAEETRVEVEPVSFLYEDNRFDWQPLVAEDFVIHWFAGTDNLRATALETARAAQRQIAERLEIDEFEQVQVYIYPSAAELQLALRLVGRDWVGGEALPEVGVVLSTISSTDLAMTEIQREIPHELTHLLLFRTLGPQGYRSLPTWLNEGLALRMEQTPDAALVLALERASQEARLIPLPDLCAPFYALGADQVVLAYAESRSVVAYLEQTYGWSGIRALTASYADGRDCSAGFEHALGMSLTDLERDWRVWLDNDGRPSDSTQQQLAQIRVVLRDLAPWLGVTLLLVLPGILGIWLGRSKSAAMP